MAFRKISNMQFVADTKEDLVNIKNALLGAECFIVKEACEYKVMSTGEWVKQTTASNAEVEAPEVDLTGYATEEYVDEAISAIKIPSVDGFVKEEDVAALMAQMRPIKYEISSLPKGAIVDYREKEIRVFCPETVEFTKQSVGATGNANMYYMAFKAYAPEGAVSFKEGDRGTIVDEMFTFDHQFAGTDKFGRNYSICWLALASYNESTNTWTYYGANSNESKYIGWTYIVEWYDANGLMIGTDKIRINLSNKDCHNLLAPYYG